MIVPIARTLRGIHDRLEHQRNEGNEEEVVNEELGRSPERRRRILSNGIGTGIFGGGRAGVGSRIGRGRGGGGEASVEGI